MTRLLLPSVCLVHFSNTSVWKHNNMILLFCHQLLGLRVHSRQFLLSSILLFILKLKFFGAFMSKMLALTPYSWSQGQGCDWLQREQGHAPALRSYGFLSLLPSSFLPSFLPSSWCIYYAHHRLNKQFAEVCSGELPVAVFVCASGHCGWRPAGSLTEQKSYYLRLNHGV